SAEELLLNKLLERCRTMGWLTARGPQRTDSTHVLAAIRVLNRLELVAETLRAALNAVATVAPDWLQAVTPLACYERYSRQIEEARLPKERAAGGADAHRGGEDGFSLLAAVKPPEGGRNEMDPPLCGSTSMSHNEFTSNEPIEPQEASPMKYEMHVLGIDIAKRAFHAV